MSLLRVSLLGKFRVRSGSFTFAELQKQKVKELFCYLLLNRKQSHSRESLASLLWQQNSQSQSKGYLRKTLWQLQSPLTKITHPKKPILLVNFDWIQVNPDADIWIDIDLLESAFMQSHGIEGRNLDPKLATYLKRCVKYYRGDLLEGNFNEWCLFERERIQRIYLLLLDKLLDYSIANSDYETGLIYGSQLLSFDIAHERTHRQLMRLYYYGGDRTLAIRQYELCVNILKNELDVSPTMRTQALMKKVLADKVLPLEHAIINSPIHKYDNSYIYETVTQLKNIQLELFSLQERIGEHLENLERRISD